MRIIYAYRGIPELTQAVHIEALIREWRGMGHDVETCFPVAASAAGAPSDSLAGRLLRRLRKWVPTSVWNAIRLCADSVTERRLRRQIASARPDAIYERYVFMSRGCVALAQDAGVPHILEVNETARLTREDWSSSVRARACRTEDEAFARTDALIAVSGVLRDHLVSLGVPREKITVMHNGIHEHAFVHIARHRASARELHGLGDRFAIGYIQGWHGSKGLYGEILEGLVEFLRRLQPAAPTAALVVVGGGAVWEDVRDSLRAQASDPTRVIFTGPVAHEGIPRLLGALDAGLIIHHEGFTSPLKLFEYMAAGLPVIAPALPNIEEVVRDGETGLLFSPGCVGEATERLLWLMANPEAARRIGEAARGKAMQEHTWRSNAERVVEIAQRLVRAPGTMGR